jgi:hypothetical protein
MPHTTLLYTQCPPPTPHLLCISSYYTVGLDEWESIGTLTEDASNWRNLSVKEVEGEDLSMAMLWLSHPSVTAHPHFDKSQNFLVNNIINICSEKIKD